jgi:hypothetical protein
MMTDLPDNCVLLIVEHLHPTDIYMMTKTCRRFRLLGTDVLVRKKSSMDAMTSAAFRGHLEVVKWLYSNRDDSFNDECVKRAIGAARRRRYPEIVDWLVDREIEKERRIKFEKESPFFRWIYSLSNSILDVLFNTRRIYRK